MADQQIVDLTDKPTLDGTELMEIQNPGGGAGSSFSALLSALRTYVLEGAKPAAMFYIDAAQEIPDSSYTKISWSGTSYDPLGILTSPDTITIPSGKSLCRVTVGVAWELNATGERVARTNINDTAPYPRGVGWDRRLPSSDSNTSNSYTSGAFAVSPADTVHIEVLQSSGGALDIVDQDPAARTFVCVELW